MTVISIPRRLWAALLAGLVIALGPAVETSAAPSPNAAVSSTAVDVDMSTPSFAAGLGSP